MVNFVFQTDYPDCSVGTDHKHSRQVRRLAVIWETVGVWSGLMTAEAVDMEKKVDRFERQVSRFDRTWWTLGV